MYVFNKSGIIKFHLLNKNGAFRGCYEISKFTICHKFKHMFNHANTVIEIKCLSMPFVGDILKLKHIFHNRSLFNRYTNVLYCIVQLSLNMPKKFHFAVLNQYRDLSGFTTSKCYRFFEIISLSLYLKLKYFIPFIPAIFLLKRERYEEGLGFYDQRIRCINFLYRKYLLLQFLRQNNIRFFTFL